VGGKIGQKAKIPFPPCKLAMANGATMLGLPFTKFPMTVRKKSAMS